MKIHLLTWFFLLMIGAQVKAQAPDWGWIKKFPNPSAGSYWSEHLSVDGAGNLYVCATFNGSINFGNNQSVTSSTTGSLLAKFNRQGDALWARKIGDCYISGFVTAASGESYITGSFSDTSNIGSNTLIAEGDEDIFVAKLDSEGSVVWIHRAGGSFVNYEPASIDQADYSTSIAADEAGNCYVVGQITAMGGGVATFGSTVVLTNTNSLRLSSGFIAKYSNTGQLQWVNLASGLFYENSLQDVAVTPDGNCFVTGNFQNSISLGNNTTLTSNNIPSIFLARYQPNGELLWANKYTGSLSTYVSGLAVNNANQPVLTGSFRGSLQFADTTLAGQSNTNYYSVFLAKLQPEGDVAWAHQLTDRGSSCKALELDQENNIYSVMPYSFQDSTTTLPLLTKWNSSGHILWTKTVTQFGAFAMYANSIAISPVTGSCYVSGQYQDSLSFGNQTIYGNYGSDFIAELANATTLSTQVRSTKDILIYPNPSSTRKLHFSMRHEAKEAALLVTDIRGQVVHSGTLPAQADATINLPPLPAGTYIITVQTSEELFRQKIVLL